jgi:hypothetical protein
MRDMVSSTVDAHLQRERALSISVGDAHVLINGLPTDLHLRLRDLLRPFVTRSSARSIKVQVRPSPHRAEWDVFCEGEATQTFRAPDELLGYLEWFALSQAIGAMTNLVAFHAAALTRDSATVLIVGKSGAGKTTLTLGMMRRGWLPLADDLVLVDPEALAVKPFPRCFHLDNSTRDLIAESVSLEWPGILSGYARPSQFAHEASPPTAIFVAQRCATCMAARMPLMQAEGAGALLAEAANTQLSASTVARTAARIAADAACYHLKNGPLDSSLNLIERAIQE